MVPNITTVLQRLTGEWATLLQPDAILAVCREIGLPGGVTGCSRRSPPCHSAGGQCSLAIPPAAICPICRADGSRRQPTVKRASGFHYASLSSS